MDRIRPLTTWWFRTPDERSYYRRLIDAIIGAAGLSAAAALGAIVASRLVSGADTALFRSINHWPGSIYVPMWLIQLTGVIGAPLVLAAVAALFRRFRLAAALVVAIPLKTSAEAVAKIFVQRGRPAETVPDVILRGSSAAHGLSFPSGHAMVIFAIAALTVPYLNRWWKVLPWVLGGLVCLSRVYLGAHFPLDTAAGAGLGAFIGSVLNLAFGVPRPRDRRQVSHYFDAPGRLFRGVAGSRPAASCPMGSGC